LVASKVERWIVDEIIAHLLPFTLLDMDYICKKIWFLVAFSLIVSKQNLPIRYSSNANPVNAHTTYDTC
jgi:hypothetical protein